jgi:hypothetical protein
MRHLVIIFILLMPGTGLLAQQKATNLNPGLQSLAAEFFAWRSKQQPVTGDDVSRVTRPDNWLPAWSREDLAIYRAMYQDYLGRLQALDRAAFSRADEVDALLLSSAIKRVGWELDVLLEPQRNPVFYVQQTLGAVFELLVLSTPWTPERGEQLVRLLNHFPVIVEQAKANLNRAEQPFALAAIELLMPIDGHLLAMQTALQAELKVSQHADLASAVSTASGALADYRLWLQKNLERMEEGTGIAPDAYQWYLSNVALLPYTASELLAMGQHSWNRAVTYETLQQNRNLDSPELPVFGSINEQVAIAARNELEIRAFLQNQQLLTIPYWLQHYRQKPMPAWLAPLAYLGSTNDLTAANRLGEDAYSYVAEPADGLPYFPATAAREPRPLLIHEGIPGHYFQLANSWMNPNPVRRQFFDSSANDGIASYVGEMLLQAGLFDFNPRSKEIVYSFMRLRALQVEVDIRLSLGDISIAEATEHLAGRVPMDRQTAYDLALRIASRPGHAIGNQVGKLQVESLLAAARLADGENFSLQAFHDSLVRNGNVPIALQRWEMLGLDDEISRLQSLASQPVGVPY